MLRLFICLLLVSATAFSQTEEGKSISDIAEMERLAHQHIGSMQKLTMASAQEI